jgi:hypothetical protein
MLSVFLQTGAPQQLNPWQLVIGASPVVQLVLVILVFMLVMCLYIIGAKWIRLKQVTDQSRAFLRLFWTEEKTRTWNAKAMNDIHGLSAKYDRSPIATVFRAGYRELARIARTGRPTKSDVENVERALTRAQSAELTRLENKVSFLATTASTAPFIGLFGTVWGDGDRACCRHSRRDGLQLLRPAHSRRRQRDSCVLQRLPEHHSPSSAGRVGHGVFERRRRTGQYAQ